MKTVVCCNPLILLKLSLSIDNPLDYGSTCYVYNSRCYLKIWNAIQQCFREAEAVATGTKKTVGEAKIIVVETVAVATGTKTIGNETKKIPFGTVAIARKANRSLTEPSTICDATKALRNADSTILSVGKKLDSDTSAQFRVHGRIDVCQESDIWMMTLP